jgi:hypothetical protein
MVVPSFFVGVKLIIAGWNYRAPSLAARARLSSKPNDCV